MEEKEIIKIENLSNRKSVYTIRWNMTSLCNYYCDFCIQGNKDKHIKNSKLESALIRFKIADKIINFIEKDLNLKYKKVNIYLIGGEITLLKDFLPILEKLTNINFEGDIHYYITTNLSANISDLLKIKEVFNKNNSSKYMRILSIDASFYKKFTTEEEFIFKLKQLHNKHKVKNYLVKKQTKFRDKKGFINHCIYKIIKKIEKRNSNIYVSISYPLINDIDYLEYLNFRKRNIKYVDNIKYIIIRKYKEEISENLKRKLKRKNNNRIKVTLKDNEILYFNRTSDIKLKINNFKPLGMLCDAGVNSITINNNGDISRCVSASKKTIIGNILECDLNLISDNLECPSTSCNCDYYSLIKK